ncbi:MAG: class D beta-lactamase [Bacteroidales bacterium]|nr:class D beta-lactamase [Bacteroidales bacterium]MCF8387543.1 class D beta-lactamase [Bacteroidales bacterium]MCF8397923.1 class D beta-lactamase [Bacteroidales bacterium]
MKTFPVLLLSIVFFSLLSCTPSEGPRQGEHKELKKIFDSYKVHGSVLIYDTINQYFYGYNLQRADSGFLPASTFKIVNSIIGLETGLLNTKDTLFRWDGSERRLEAWEKDMTLKEAFQSSCVPCYQQLARAIGPVQMSNWLHELDYGNMIVRNDNIDKFWLEGNSRISQREQIDFLRRLYMEELPVSTSTSEAMKEIMRIEDAGNYRLYGKTGWAIRNNNNTGWFVGYYETNDNVYFVAVNIEPATKEVPSDFGMIRKQILAEVMQKLGLLG